MPIFGIIVDLSIQLQRKRLRRRRAVGSTLSKRALQLRILRYILTFVTVCISMVMNCLIGIHLKSLIVIILMAIGAPAISQDEVNQMVDGKRQGFWRIELKNGQTQEGTYELGKQEGVWKTYDKDGRLKNTITYTHGRAIGEAVFYFPDGTVQEKGVWNIDHWEGEYVRNNDNGKPACKFTYDNRGRREGRQVYYYPNGKVQYNGTWKAGKISGTLYVFNEQGQKVMERNYDENGSFTGSLSGEMLPASQSNELFKGTGNYTLFNPDGTVDKKGYFDEGRLVNGTRCFYDAKGNCIRSEKVVDGQVVQ